MQDHFLQPAPIELLDFIEKQHWTFAKTMPDNPHFYIVRKRVKDQQMFNGFVAYIRRYGYEGRWGTHLYYYLQIDNYIYWTMGAPVTLTTIVNRKAAPRQQYDEIASQYSDKFSREEYRHEDESLWNLVREKLFGPGEDWFEGPVLEIGCGSGNFIVDNHHYIKTPGDYLGFDPSIHMMRQCADDLPMEFQRRMVVSNGEQFRFTYGSFAYLVSFYGSCNYISIASLMRMLNYHNGRLFLMLYKPEYKPVYEDIGDLHSEAVSSWTAVHRAIGNLQMYQVEEFNNYKIIIR